MTISTTSYRSGPYHGNGSAVAFVYEFRILDPSQIAVTLTTGGIDAVVPHADYTVFGAGEAAGGYITFDTPPAAGQKVTITRNAALTQQADLENQGAYFAETIERALDLAAMRDQQLQEQISRAVSVPVGSGISPIEFLDGRIADAFHNVPPPADGNDAANKQYVDSSAAAVRAAALAHADAGDTALRNYVDVRDALLQANIAVVAAGNLQQYATRADLVSAVAGGATFANKQLIYAGGYFYEGVFASTAIPDIPGVEPHGDIHVEHFGARGDLTYELRTNLVANADTGSTSGYVRTGGTNQLAAFMAADAFAVTHRRKYFAKGQFFLDGEFTPKGELDSGNNFESVLWHRYGVYQCAIRIWTSFAKVTGFRHILQYDHPSIPKPAGSGHLGTGVTINDYYSPTRQNRIVGVHIKGLFCRAGHISGEQPSSPSAITFAIGWNEDCDFEVGVHGKTNVPSGSLYATHWGCWYDPDTLGMTSIRVTAGGSGYTTPPPVSFIGGGAPTVTPQALAVVSDGVLTGITLMDPGEDNSSAPTVVIGGPGSGAAALADYRKGDTGPGDKPGARILETYHSLNCRVKILTDIHCVVDGHGFANIVSLASCGGYEVSDFSATGGIMGLSLECGDVCDHYAIPEQKNAIGKGINCGFITMTDCRKPPDWAVVAIKGSGTSKAYQDRYGDGNTAFVQRMLNWGFTIKGIRITSAFGYQANACAVSAFFCLGKGDFGTVESYGYGREVEAEHCHGDFHWTVIGGDGELRYEFSHGGSFIDTNVTCAAPMNAGGFAVGLSGREMTTVTTAAVAAGADKTPIVGIATDEISVDDKVKIGPYWVTATMLIDNGLSPWWPPVPYIKHTPLPGAVAAGSPVLISQHADMRHVALASGGAQHGLSMLYASIADLDASRFKYSGSHAVELRSSHVRMRGDFPQGGGSLGLGSGTHFQLWGDKRSTAIIDEAFIDANPAVAKLIHFDYGPGDEFGSVLLNKCRIADIANLMDQPNAQHRQLSMRQCIDISGTNFKEMAHPTMQGSNANGYWKYHEDGVLECWIRNAVTDANGDFHWTFPKVFTGGGATVAVNATSAALAVGVPRTLIAGPPSSTQVHIKSMRPDGPSEASAFHGKAIGRWFV